MRETINKFLRRKIFTEVALIGGLVLFVVGMILMLLSQRLSLALSISIGGFVLFAFSAGGYTKLMHDYKHHFIEASLSGIVKNAKHVPHEGLSMHQIRDGGYNIAGLSFKNHFLSGFIDQTAFVSSDLHTEQPQPMKLFIVEMNRQFRTNLMLYPEAETSHHIPHDYTRIHEGRIMKDFPLRINAEHKFETAHVLTPYIARFIKDLVELDRNKTVSIAFYKSRLSVLFQGGFDFTFKAYRALPQAEIKRLRRAMSALQHIIEALAANPYAFKRTS